MAGPIKKNIYKNDVQSPFKLFLNTTYLWQEDFDLCMLLSSFVNEHKNISYLPQNKNAIVLTNEQYYVSHYIYSSVMQNNDQMNQNLRYDHANTVMPKQEQNAFAK